MRIYLPLMDIRFGFLKYRILYSVFEHTVRPSGCVTNDTGAAWVGPLHMTATYAPQNLGLQQLGISVNQHNIM